MNSDAPEPDRLRDELKDLGYLESPLSRFFVGGIRGPRPAWRTHMRVGIGVGIALGGVLALLLVLVSLAAPPFPTLSAQDALVLLAWFVIVGGLGAMLLGLLSGVILFAFFRMTRRFVDKVELSARNAFLAAFAGSFVYLVLFWRHYGPSLGERSGLSAWVLDPLAFLAILFVALLAGRVMHAAALAVTASIPGFGVLRRAAPKKRDRVLIALGVLLAIAAPIVFRAAKSRPPEFAEAGVKVERVAPLAKRVVLIAIDGMSEDNANNAIAHGWMPELMRMRDAGAAHALVNARGSVPPAFWTTAVTGLSVERHGIDSYFRNKVLGLSQAVDFEPRAPGLGRALAFLLPALGMTEEVAVTGSMTRVKRVIDVAAEAGLSVASINFWSTWPADPANGITVSERAYLEVRAADQLARKNGSAFAIRDPRAVAPATLLERLRAALPDSTDLKTELPEITAAELENTIAVARPALYDLFVERVTLDVLEHEHPDYTQSCLTGLDILRTAWRRQSASDDAWQVRWSSVVEGYYRSLDRFLGRLRIAAGDDALIVVAGCPGISGGDTSSGILVVAPRGGAPAPRESADAARSPESLAPTLLFALGLPASAEQDGAVDVTWFSAETLARAHAAPRMVPAFGLKPKLEIADANSGDYLDFLSQLGYFTRPPR